MNRRDFLLITGLLTLGTGACTQLPAAHTGTGRTILVIGAGIAGLATANRLLQAGQRVMVLEARARSGGRIWTSTAWASTPLDLGASWIHGVDGNPITALAESVAARLAVTSYDRAITYGTTGDELSAQEQQRLTQLQRAIERALRDAQDAETDVSVQRAVEAALDWEQLPVAAQRTADFIVNSTIEHEYGGDSRETSAFWYDAADEFDGEDVLFRDGYRTVVDLLARNVPISFNQVVQQIAWDGDGVTVTTNQGLHRADHVVVTLPLGVLQSGDITFTPALPPRKQHAIATLRMGVLNKCYLRFPTTFWPAEYDWLEYIPAQRGLWSEWVSFARLTGAPILLGFNAAAAGRTLERWSDAAIVDSAMTTLRTIFGSGIPDPEAHQITRWLDDPFARGSYSFNALGATPALRDHLAARVENRLFFAGEATSRDYFGTVHGAYLSGVRAADDVLRTLP